MSARKFRWFRTLLATALTVALLLMTPATAMAFRQGLHEYAAEQGYWRFVPANVGGADTISRSMEVALYPELESLSAFYQDGIEGVEDQPVVDDFGWKWIWQGSFREDDYDSEYDAIECTEKTGSHFWNDDPDNDGGINDSLSAVSGYNAWDKGQEMWTHAVDYWRSGQTGWAYFYLGKVLHLLVDQSQPAHPHEDTHAATDDDCLEEWADEEDVDGTNYGEPLLSWSDPDLYPGEILYPPYTNEEILSQILSRDWVDEDGDLRNDLWVDGYPVRVQNITDGEVEWEDKLRHETGYEYNIQRLFYLFYCVNQVGDFAPSDGYDYGAWTEPEPGDRDALLGWVDFDQFSQGVMSMDLEDNDSSCDHPGPVCKYGQCNLDGELSRILDTTYRFANRAVPAFIDLFRKTVDNVPPVTTVDVARADGKDLKEWNNSPVTVKLVDAVDHGNANDAWRASGVWQRWGACDGQAPSITDNSDKTPYWTISADGKHAVELMSTDMCGNVEGAANDFEVWVDLTPPEIQFPDLRPNYLTSEVFVPTWDAWDETSGIDHVTAYLDGNIVPKDTPVDLSLKAGNHTLSVYAMDKAENWTHKTYEFEVWIDTSTSAKPIQVNAKSNGESMMVDVEFPAPYDVSAIDLATCRLRVGGTIELSEQFPVMGGYTTLEGTLLGGVSDADKDGLPERAIKFDKGAFVDAIAGQTGDISAVAWGGLLPDGSPRFLGPVTVPVFAPPVK